MANYDLPWNPNRLEQRFGRIHRIGQTEVCHLWNLVASETREGAVYHTLLKKLEEERQALGGQVFDVLGKIVFQSTSSSEGTQTLRDLLLQAIRYGDQPDVRARLNQVVDEALDREHLRALIDEHALVQDSMDLSRVRRIREDMERAEARRLQPHYVASFFVEAFRHLGGTVREREPGRYEVTHVPAPLRRRDRLIGTGSPVLPRYERITFEKQLIAVPGKPLAAFVCPGHPLLDATTDLILERYRDLLKRGTVLVDPGDSSEDVRALFYLEHAIQDARTVPGGHAAGVRRVASRQMQFVEIDAPGVVRAAGYAPYLDYRPLAEGERELIERLIDESWLTVDLEGQALGYAVEELVPRHFEEIRTRREELVVKTMVAVKDRLTKEIVHWDHRAEQLRAQEEAGRTPRLNSARARQRCDDLEARLERRMQELEEERQLAPLPPVAIGGALIIPAGLLVRLASATLPGTTARDTARSELVAMAAVIEAERRLGFQPRDVSAERRGYDIESGIPGSGSLRFVEVKGRATGSATVTVTRNEILCGLNKPEDFILALVEVDGDAVAEPRYVRRPFGREPDFGVTSVNYGLGELLERAAPPA